MFTVNCRANNFYDLQLTCWLRHPETKRSRPEMREPIIIASNGILTLKHDVDFVCARSHLKLRGTQLITDCSQISWRDKRQGEGITHPYLFLHPSYSIGNKIYIKVWRYVRVRARYTPYKSRSWFLSVRGGVNKIKRREVLPSLLINVRTQNGFEYLRTLIESHSIIFSQPEKEEKMLNYYIAAGCECVKRDAYALPTRSRAGCTYKIPILLHFMQLVQ